MFHPNRLDNAMENLLREVMRTDDSAERVVSNACWIKAAVGVRSFEHLRSILTRSR